MREIYLDGLRGWAAVIVVLCHTGNVLWPTWRPLLYPLFTDGSLSVFVFFVLSGYVLSVGFFRTGDRRAVIDLALRRYPRLTMPIFGAAALAMVLMAFGMMHNIPAGKAAGSEGWLSTFYTFTPTVPDLLHFSLWRVYVDGTPATSYDSSLWTMPIEMQGSILVFAALLVMGGSAVLRGCIHVTMLSISCWLASPLFALAAGAAIANLTQLKLHQRLCDSRAEPFVSWSLLGGGLVFAAFRPEILEPVWLTLCSSALLYGVLLNGRVQRALSTPISQWLGRISFSLYLLHILVICSFTSWGYLALSQEGVLSSASAALILGATFILCLSAATFFYPLERLGMALGRGFSKAILRKK